MNWALKVDRLEHTEMGRVGGYWSFQIQATTWAKKAGSELVIFLRVRLYGISRSWHCKQCITGTQNMLAEG